MIDHRSISIYSLFLYLYIYINYRQMCFFFFFFSDHLIMYDSTLKATSVDFIAKAKIIKSFPQDGVVGAEVIYPSTIWLVPPRQIFEWVAFNASVADQEYWFAVSSLHVEKLKEECVALRCPFFWEGIFFQVLFFFLFRVLFFSSLLFLSTAWLL